MDARGQHHSPPTLSTRKNSGARGIWGWEGPRESERFGKEENLLTLPGFETRGQSIPYPSHYTNRPTTALYKSCVLTQTAVSVSANPSCFTNCWHDNTHLRLSTLSKRCGWGLRSSGMLRHVNEWLKTDVSRHPRRLIFSGRNVQRTCSCIFIEVKRGWALN